MLKTFILIPTGHGIYVYRRRGTRAKTRLLGYHRTADALAVAEAICADMPSLACDPAMMAARLATIIAIADEAGRLAVVPAHEIVAWHHTIEEAPLCSSPTP